MNIDFQTGALDEVVATVGIGEGRLRIFGRRYGISSSERTEPRRSVRAKDRCSTYGFIGLRSYARLRKNRGAVA